MANKRAPKKGRPHAAVGDRLEQFRTEILDVNQAGMAQIADLSEGQWSVFQSGTRLITRDAAIRLCEEYPDLSLDWIYFGRTDGLSPEYRKKLG
jgi:plasmid maintenance system antidote protein VapI